MAVTLSKPDTTSQQADWQATLLTMLPTIQKYLRIAFRNLPREEAEEALAEATAHVCIAIARLAQQNRLQLAYPTVLARYSAARISVGRSCATPQNANDVTSPYAQRKRGVRSISLDSCEDSWRDIVLSDSRRPVSEQVAFRLDFPAWLKTLHVRDRRVALTLCRGENTSTVADRFKLTPGRISQLRRELCDSWRAFIGEPASASVAQ